MHYRISYSETHRHFINIQLDVDVTNISEAYFQIPSWRPGRYELGNFAKNIRRFEIIDENNQEVKYQKTNKDRWHISCEQGDKISIKYQFYANELNAGSTYLDENQLYVNPINCCGFIDGLENQPSTIEIMVPESYKIAIALPLVGPNTYALKSFDELVESPFIASPSLTKWMYQIYDYTFYIWFQGKVYGNKEKVLDHFKSFSKYQIDQFGKLPVKEYHFLYQLTPFKSYHGVEHTASTVITLGPDKEVFEEKLYEEFLGVSSHELYHAWNIKALRPSEMKPYNYTGENYSKLGFIYEGLTTYMGDLCLWESKAYTNEQFQHSFEVWFEKHFYNEGRSNLSVADSSFETWLDGYVLGIPGRKVSIYQDGALCMFMIDSLIRDYSKGKYSLHTVIKEMFADNDILKNGYTESYIRQIFVQFGGEKVDQIFTDHIYGTKDYSRNLKIAFNLRGWEWREYPNSNCLESRLGIQVMERDHQSYIYRVQEGSTADKNGISVGDILLNLNGKPVNIKNAKSFEDLKSFNLKIKKKFGEKELKIEQQKDLYFPKFKVIIR